MFSLDILICLFFSYKLLHNFISWIFNWIFSKIGIIYLISKTPFFTDYSFVILVIDFIDTYFLGISSVNLKKFLPFPAYLYFIAHFLSVGWIWSFSFIDAFLKCLVIFRCLFKFIFINLVVWYYWSFLLKCNCFTILY